MAASNKQAVSMKVPSFFGKPRRPSFGLCDVIDYMQSPCTSSGSSSAHSRLSRGSRNSFLMDDLQEHLQAAVKNSSNLVESRVEISTVDEKKSGIHEGSSIDKEEYAVGKEGSTIDNEGSTVDKEGSTVDMEDHGEKVNKLSSTLT